MKKTIIDRLYVWGFTGVLAVMAVLFLVLPKEAFSETENRSLQKLPVFSWDRLSSKEFSKDVELYISDHFPFRTEWVAGKSAAEQLRLQMENNGIYKGKDGWLFEKFDEPDRELLAKYIEAVKLFAQKQTEAHLTFLLAPNSIGIYPERLPWMASAYPQQDINKEIGQQLGDSLTFLNGYDILKPEASSPRPLFYRTDHHWTSYGAYIAYRAYAESMGWTPLDEEQFAIRTVTNTFYGSYHTRSQFSGLNPDEITVYEPKTPLQLELQIVDDGTVTDTLYDESYLDKKDKYSYFQGGVHALMKLNNKSGHTDMSKLLVIKDSYAHSLLPFLAHHVDEIHVIDIRYYNGSIGKYMNEHDIDNVLLLFNTSTFVEENNLLKLKY